jgi:hypothetical protein
MSAQQTFSTNDLRSASVDYKRDSENKHKWAQGEAWGPGRPTNAHSRPARMVPKYVIPREGVRQRVLPALSISHASRERRLTKQCRFPRSNKELGTKDLKTAQRHEIFEETQHSGDSSAEEDPAEPSAAPEAELAYSFDARAGPSHGSQILSIAVAKAVERYENNVTDQLVKDEYEVLNQAGEPVPVAADHKSGKAGKKPVADSVVVNEDEYEFV